MKNDFDNRIKGLLEGSSPADAGFELDRKAVWNSIESKQQTRIIPFKKWISHAAAVVIGILLCLPFLFRSEKETIKTVTVTKTIPSVQTINDTVFVEQNPKPNETNLHKRLQPQKETTPENIAQSTLQPKQQEENKNIADVKPERNYEQVIAKVETSKPKIEVLHLADMENENSLSKINQHNNYALFNKIIIPVHMDDKSVTASMIVSNQFFNSKN